MWEKLLTGTRKKVQYLAPLLPGKIVYKRVHYQDLLQSSMAYPALASCKFLSNRVQGLQMGPMRDGENVVHLND
jgi:hypothetical protein